MGKLYEANELDECLENLSQMDESISDSTLLAVLTILNELKSYESNASFDLVIILLFKKIIFSIINNKH